MKTRYANVTVDPDRHGKLRARYRKGAVSQYMKTLPDQPGFEAELKALAETGRTTDPRHAPGSVHDLCARYYRCADFAGRGTDETKTRRRGLIESFRNEFGNDQVKDFNFEHIEAILIARTVKTKTDKGRVFGGEVAAVKLRKELLRLFAYAMKLKWITANPVAEAEKVGRDKLVGFYPWSEADITVYKAKHAIGTKARLALEIMLWTGQRRSDARLFGPKHIVSGKAAFVPGKTKRGVGMMLAPDLRKAIDAMPSVGITTFLVTDFGKPFSRAGFGNKMREWCDEAGLPQCTAHGLRKAIARRVAQTEGTQQQLKAVGGWRGDDEVSLYTESVEQERLADVALTRVIATYSDGEKP